MMEDYHCIICSKPTHDGVLGSIRDITVSLCKEHVGICSQGCDSCAHASTCKISMLGQRN